ncbi:hypothetical protein GCM10010381_25760 [Streptomyces xantholiticus]|nr:hypothetical protein GCM10010381_25760 [Streptomyces xantholiticus]
MGGALPSLVASTAVPAPACLPVSEVFPMETRPMAIVFRAGGTAAGGVSGPCASPELGRTVSRRTPEGRRRAWRQGRNISRRSMGGQCAATECADSVLCGHPARC